MDLQFLASTPLFAGVDPADIEKMLSCLSIHQRRYEKDSYILTAEQTPADIGVVLPGQRQPDQGGLLGQPRHHYKNYGRRRFRGGLFLHGSQNHACQRCGGGAVRYPVPQLPEGHDNLPQRLSVPYSPDSEYAWLDRGQKPDADQ